MEDGRWGMGDGRWEMEDGRWKTGVSSPRSAVRGQAFIGREATSEAGTVPSRIHRPAHDDGYVTRRSRLDGSFVVS
jgi:hypothetical protein